MTNKMTFSMIRLSSLVLKMQLCELTKSQVKIFPELLPVSRYDTTRRER